MNAPSGFITHSHMDDLVAEERSHAQRFHCLCTNFELGGASQELDDKSLENLRRLDQGATHAFLEARRVVLPSSVRAMLRMSGPMSAAWVLQGADSSCLTAANHIVVLPLSSRCLPSTIRRLRGLLPC